MKYEDMSYFEINSKVAMRLGRSVSIEHECIKTGACFILTSLAGVRVEFNPCNNPSDAWPIIVDNGISVMMTSGSCGDLWTCGVANFHDGMWSFDNEITGEYVDFETYGGNPLRAAMICFLKMKDAQQ